MDIGELFFAPCDHTVEIFDFSVERFAKAP